MKNIRIGNDIRVTLTVTRHGHRERLDDKDLVVILRNRRKAVEITDFHIEDGNRVVFVWRGEEQEVLGPYYATLYERKNGRQNVEDTGYIFNLVPCSHEIHEGGCGCGHDGIECDKIDVGVQVGAWCDWHEHSDYRKLHHRPSINGVELLGNMSLHALGIQPEGDYIEKEKWERLREAVDALGVLPFDGFAYSEEELPSLADKGDLLLGGAGGLSRIFFIDGVGDGFYLVEPDGKYSRAYYSAKTHSALTNVVYRCGSRLYTLEGTGRPDLGQYIWEYHLKPYATDSDFVTLDTEQTITARKEFEITVNNNNSSTEVLKLTRHADNSAGGRWYGKTLSIGLYNESNPIGSFGTDIMGGIGMTQNLDDGKTHFLGISNETPRFDSYELLHEGSLTELDQEDMREILGVLDNSNK